MSKRPNTSKPTDRQHVFTHFPKYPICAICRLATTTPALCKVARKHEETVLIVHKNLVMLQRRIINFSMRRKNLASSIVLQSWCRTFILIGFNAPLQRLKLFKKRGGVCKSSCRQDRNQVSFIHTSNSLVFFVFVKTCVGITTSHSPYRSEINGHCRERSP